MNIKTVSWNIGGAKTLEPGADPTLMASYNVDAVDYIVEKLQEISPDIIAFQEIQKSDAYDQAEIIASKLGYEYFSHFSFSWSHNEEGADLGNAIISRYPIVAEQSGTFINPNITVTWEDGRTEKTHDKGYVQTEIDINGIVVSVLTLHLSPFRKYGMEYDDPKAQEILTDVSGKIVATSKDTTIVLGDFNIDNPTVFEYLPGLAENGFSEIPTEAATTPKDRRYDHILTKGLKLVNASIDNSVLTDHYVLVTELTTE